MSSTSLRLSDELKQDATAAAEERGISPHAFMVDAIAQAATAAEHRADFVTAARVAREQMYKTGKGYDAGEVAAYLKGRIAGTNPAKPRARSWRS